MKGFLRKFRKTLCSAKPNWTKLQYFRGLSLTENNNSYRIQFQALVIGYVMSLVPVLLSLRKIRNYLFKN